jgi:hypothetical protein
LKAGARELGDDAFAMVIEYSLSRARLSASQLKRERCSVKFMQAGALYTRLTKAARLTRHTAPVCLDAAKTRFLFAHCKHNFYSMAQILVRTSFSSNTHQCTKVNSNSTYTMNMLLLGLLLCKSLFSIWKAISSNFIFVLHR